MTAPLFCYDKISDYTAEKIAMILKPYVIMGLEEETEGPLQKISALEKELIPRLQQIAVDYEQEITKLFKLYLPRILKEMEKFSRSHNGQFTLKDVTEYITELARDGR
jgi:hypothetical protein